MRFADLSYFGYRAVVVVSNEIRMLRTTFKSLGWLANSSSLVCGGGGRVMAATQKKASPTSTVVLPLLPAV